MTGSKRRIGSEAGKNLWRGKKGEDTPGMIEESPEISVEPNSKRKRVRVARLWSNQSSECERGGIVTTGVGQTSRGRFEGVDWKKRRGRRSSEFGEFALTVKGDKSWRSQRVREEGKFYSTPYNQRKLTNMMGTLQMRFDRER